MLSHMQLQSELHMLFFMEFYMEELFSLISMGENYSIFRTHTPVPAYGIYKTCTLPIGLL